MTEAAAERQRAEAEAERQRLPPVLPLLPRAAPTAAVCSALKYPLYAVSLPFVPLTSASSPLCPSPLYLLLLPWLLS
jgi:hypothetical protein